MIMVVYHRLLLLHRVPLQMIEDHAKIQLDFYFDDILLDKILYDINYRQELFNMIMVVDHR